LINVHVACNQAMADHPTVQVAQLEDGTFAVGLLGILNGLFGADENGQGYIAAGHDEEELVWFCRLTSR
jgi:hypothetical protein